MTPKTEFYEHSVSAHTREPEILVVRNKLEMFPAKGTDFTVIVGDHNCTSRIVARRCLCAGPDSPHEHYYIDLTELNKLLDWGTFSRIRIRKLSANRYALTTIK